MKKTTKYLTCQKNFFMAYAIPNNDSIPTDYNKVTKLVSTGQEDMPTLLQHLEKCVNLEEINIRGNYNYNFKKIAAILANLKKLKKLTILNACLKRFPQSFLALKQIEYLDFSENNLKTLPCSIANMPNLKKL